MLCCWFQVPKVTYTEFCQGRTMRWALAWSFYDDVTVPVSRDLASISPNASTWWVLVSRK